MVTINISDYNYNLYYLCYYGCLTFSCSFLKICLQNDVPMCSRIVAKHDIMTRVFRLWAEVFHVNSSGAGTVKWQQVSEDLVPVNITCIQDSPECVFHITAYNSQVDKILDVRLVQPGISDNLKYSNQTPHSCLKHLNVL